MEELYHTHRKWQVSLKYYSEFGFHNTYSMKAMNNALITLGSRINAQVSHPKKNQTASSEVNHSKIAAINSDIFNPIQNVFGFSNVTFIHDGQLL